MKRLLVVHPFLLALFPALFLFSHNLREVPPGNVVAPLVLLAAAAGVLLLLGRLVLRDYARSGLVASAFFVLFFSYGHVFGLVGEWRVAGLRVGREQVLLPAWVLLGLLVAAGAARMRGGLRETTRIFNLASAVLVLGTLVPIATYAARGGFASRRVDLGEYNRPLALPSHGPRPDIYYLIFDRYGGRDALQELYNFDNREFLDSLQARGFYLASESTGNYPTTIQSLASSLNMRYLDFITAKVGRASDDWLIVGDVFRDHQVGRTLRSLGYEFVLVSSWWDPTKTSPLADVTLQYDAVPEFSRVLLETTALRPIGNKLQGISDRLTFRRVQWRTSKFQFDALAETRAIRGPKFVFAHILLPHDPYVFDREGNFVPTLAERARSREQNFVDQLTYTNRRILEVVDVLLSSPAASHPVVILQADEGPAPRRYERLQTRFTWGAATTDEIRLKFPILNAYYLPGVDDPGLYPSITPVNSFRQLFNLYFDAGLPLLPDDNYVFTDWQHIYDFLEVTDRVKSTPAQAG